MKAILLTFDAQIGFAELVVKKYDRLWPSHPFEFLIPHQDLAAVPDTLRRHPRCRLVAAPRGMRGSMQVLVGGLDPAEWVFWTIDDRYPTAVHDIAALSRLAGAVQAGEADSMDGVRLIRWRETLSAKTETIAGLDFRLPHPGQLHGFYLHQFLRAGALQEVFLSPNLPDDYRLRELHDHFVAEGAFARSNRMAVPAQSLMSFAEPCKGGRLVSIALTDLTEMDCKVPDYPVIEGSALYNEQTRGWP